MTVASHDTYPLSAQQEFHWETLCFRSLGREIAGRDGPFIALRIEGELQIERLRQVLSEMLSRHEVLRSVLTDLTMTPEQRVVSAFDAPLSVVDLSHVLPSQRAQLADQLVQSERTTEFDLLDGPMWRCLVIVLSPGSSLLVLHFCHLILDGVSLMSFLDQLLRLYGGEEVAPPKLQYRDAVERSLRKPPDHDQRLAHWVSELAPIGGDLRFPTDHSARPPSLVSTRTQALSLSILGSQFRNVCRSLSATPFACYAAAYAALIACTANVERVTLGSSLFRQDLRADDLMLGYFLDVILLPMRVKPGQTLRELVGQASMATLQAQQRTVPYVELASALHREFDAERPWPAMNLYDAWVRGRVFDAAVDDSVSIGKMDLSLYALTTGYTDLDIAHPRQSEAYSQASVPSLYLDDAEGTRGYLEYNRAVLGPTSMSRIAGRLDALIGCMGTPAMTIQEAWRAVRQQEVRAK